MKESAVLLLFAIIIIGLGECARNHHKVPARPNKRNNASAKALKPIMYYTKPNHTITIPVMIHLDKVLTGNRTKGYRSKQTRQNTRLYFKNILNHVEKFYTHPSLNQKLRFILLDVKILNNATKEIRMDENVANYLNSYCQWQGQKKIKKKKWFYSVLFTGLDLFYFDMRRRQNKSNAARGYLRGICSVRHSCSLLEWDDKNVAYMIAHELGHSLGLPHDGPPYNECHGQYIMATKFNPLSPASTWSPCNKIALERFLLSDQSWCLRPEYSHLLLD